MIHAPFNFAPLSPDVYYPTWADKISLEVPFEKSYSGYLDFIITAKSPVFVRNGSSQEQNEKMRKLCISVSKKVNQEIARQLNIDHLPSREKEQRILSELENHKERWEKRFTDLVKDEVRRSGDNLSAFLFSNIEDRFFIPSTSIKGCIRNALEIVSLGKMSQFSDDRYGFREITNLYLSGMSTDDIHCGYLTVKEGKVFIEDHGIPYRISHTALDQGIENLNFQKEYGREYRRSKISPYHKINILQAHAPLPTRFSNERESFNRLIVRIDEKGPIEGDIIVTGQPGKRDYRTNKGKFYEFVFPRKIQGTFSREEDSRFYQDFLFINGNEESESWNTWKKKLLNGKQVPIFFTLKNGEIRDMGFSYMYKRAYNNSISSCLYEDHDSNRMDMAECIFGKIKGKALKGRVQFSNAFVEKMKDGENLIRRLILNSPKASYYPMYLEQSGNSLISYQDSEAVINGWKKYPIRRGSTFKNMNNAKLDSFLIPLSKDTTFRCRMNFFNLKGAELGALLSVLTFHGSTDEYYFSIGQGKPYGYGKVKIELSQLYLNDEQIEKDQIKERSLIFMKTFEKDLFRTIYETNKAFEGWHESETVKEFYTMSYDTLEASNSLLQYMDLNDFSVCKRNKEYLQRFSEICNMTKAPKSLMINESNAKTK